MQYTNTEQDIIVEISASHPEAQLVQEIKELGKTQDRIEPNTLKYTKFGTQNISFYKYITVLLVNGVDSQFTIKPLPGQQDRQLIDSSFTNKWQWSVKPNIADSKGNLKVIAFAEKPDGTPEQLPDEAIHIKLKIKVVSIFYAIWQWMVGNPKFVLSSMLIPAIAFLVPWWLNRKKKQNGEENADSK